MRLSEHIDQMNNLYAEVGDADIRFTGLHNTYSPEAIIMTRHNKPKPGEDKPAEPFTLILTGHPINSWPMPEMKVTPEVDVQEEVNL